MGTFFANISDDTILEEYNRKDRGFLIEYSTNNNKTCCIYFTGNGLFYPETEDRFKNDIVDKNKFDWYRARIGDEKKSIFLRDITKSFYVIGINQDINSIDKIIEWCKIETEDYDDIITIGGSAGGYMALIVGVALNAKKVFCFSGQIDLWNYHDFKNKALMCLFKGDSNKSKYYNIESLINKCDSRTQIVYVTPTLCKEDVFQSSLIENKRNVTVVKIKSRKHGVPFYKESLPTFFRSSEEKLEKVSQCENSLLRFSLEYGGVCVFFKGVFNRIVQLKKRVLLCYSRMVGKAFRHPI